MVNGSLYVWNGSSWENVGNIKGEKGDTGSQGIQGIKGDTGDRGFSPIVNVDHTTGKIIITTQDGSSTISFTELKGDTCDKGVKGYRIPEKHLNIQTSHHNNLPALKVQQVIMALKVIRVQQVRAVMKKPDGNCL